jgi:hypothetical protein
VLFAAKDLARASRVPIGQVVSDMAREGFAASRRKSSDAVTADGLPTLPSRGGIVTNEAINRLREELGL